MELRSDGALMHIALQWRRNGFVQFRRESKTLNCVAAAPTSLNVTI